MSEARASRAPTRRKQRERINLTDRKIASLKPRPGKIIDLADSYVHGLHLRIRPSGNKSWSVVLRQSGRFRRFSLGHYPGMGLTEARNEAQTLLPGLRKGDDPIRDRKAQQSVQAANGVVTFADLIAAYDRIAIPQKKRTRSWPESRRTIERVFADALPVPVAQFGKANLQIGLDRTAVTAPVSARAAWEAVSPVLRWAEKRELLPIGLRDRVAPPERSVRNKRDNVLSDDELRAAWAVLDKERYPFGLVYKLLLLTGQRRGEVAGMTWNEIDFDSATWTIPRERMKQARDHVVPLSADAIAILRDAERIQGRKRALVFATSPVRSKATRPKDAVILKEGGQPLSNWDRVHKRILRDSETTGWTKHDLRRVVATHMGRLGIAPHVIEHVLGHADPLASAGLSSVAGVYMRYDYGKEKREALEKWAASLRDILAAKSNVVPLVPRRARS